MTEKGERRAHRRLSGPFDAVRLGLLEFRMRLYDLSAGGCLLDSLADLQSDRPIRLRVVLPDGNTITVRGEIIPPRRDIGYAVRFIDLDQATREKIEEAFEYTRHERAHG